MAKQSVYVTRMIPEQTIDTLREHFDVNVNPEDRAHTREELLKAVRGRDAVVSLLTDKIDGEVLDAAGPQCRIVANYAVGFNNFDLDAASARGVIMTNTPGVLDDATATHAWALLLATARRVSESERYVRAGKWEGWAPMAFIGQDVDNKTLGIAGLGRIGSKFARKAAAFDMNIIYTDAKPNEAFERQYNARFVDKATLLRESDYLSLHLPLLPETHHYIGAAELAAMKPTAVLINAARGPLVDEKALVVALKDKVIWGAGLDVFEHEPALAPGLAGLDNVVIVPHIASATTQTRLAMGKIVTDNVIRVLKSESPLNCINPQVLR
ncbi:Glyoxylate reductase / Hydroxypyruvate reductase [Caballeronia glathei]|uniref:Glyoxylate reductase n=1 Tax=Caballeronia glathei TaxID=60547 RepID=A0A069PCI2_9BURK|nr:D-glycerate dehydrogenase [Caballeronia glathei]KDR38408.1 glyoxylate reductase [Caballeronia glathei]CDY74232.1 Glyoxylate reductase / Hydroxypyruvate reductase [Caballeronia glathei]